MNSALTDARLVARLQALSKLVAAAAIAIGCTVMLGWLFNIETFKRVLPGLVTMKFNPALAYALAGIGLFNVRGKPRIAQATAIAIVLLGLLTLSEYLFGWQLGIDQFFMRDTETAVTAFPGRMAVIAAINLCLVGSALLLLARTRHYRLANIVTLIAAVFALLALLGYLYDAEELYQIFPFSSLALHAAVTFILLCVGLLTAYPDQGFVAIISASSAGGYVARRLLPVALLIPIGVGWLRWEGQVLGLYDTGFGLALFTLSNIIIFSGVIVWIARTLHTTDIERTQAIEALHQSHEQLELRVQERTAELHKSEELLRQSEAKFSTAFRASPAAISIATLPDGRWIEINQALAKMTGYSSEELIGHTSAEFGLVDDAARAKILASIRTKGSVRDVEIQMRTRSNEIIDVLMSTEQIELNGQVCVLTIQYDITELKRAEAALRENEQKLQTFFNILPVGVSVMNSAGQIIEMNPALERIMGISKAGMASGVYKSRKYIRSDGTPLLPVDFPSVRALEEQQTIHDTQIGIINEDEAVVWTSVSATPLPLAHSGVIVVTVDITERKQAESRFRALLDSAPDAMVIVNQQGNIVLVNSQTEVLFGYAREELVSKPIEMLIPERFRSQHPAHRTEYIADPHVRGMGVGLELYALRKDGSQFPVEISLSPIETTEGFLIAAAVRDVTERKRAEETLAQLAAIVESSDDAIIGKTLDGTITSWNAGAERVFGYTASEMIGHSIQMLFPPGQEDEEPKIMARLKRGELIDQFESVRVTKDGRHIPVSLTISPVKNATGNIIGASKIARDITERKQADEALRNSEEQFRSAFNHAAIGMALVSVDGRWLQVNRALCEIVGYSEPELLSKTFQDITHPDDLDSDLNYVRQVLAGEIESYQMEKRYFHKLGHEVWVLLSVSLVRDIQGQPLHFISEIQNITQRKQAEGALAAERNLLRTLIDHMPDYVFVKDTAGRFVISNEAHTNTTAKTIEEIIGKTSLEVFPLELADQYYVDDLAVIQSGQPIINVERRIADPTGQEKWGLTTKVPLRDPNGQVTGLVGITRDITERKQAEDALRENEEKLQTIFQLLPVGAAVMNNDKRLVQMNLALEKILGLTMDDLLMGKYRSRQYIHSDGTPLLPTDFPSERAILERQAIFDDEIGILKEDGAMVWTSVSAAPLPYNQGVVTVSVDITERKRMEATLKALHEITIELANIDDLDDFYKRAIELGLQRLGFERLGLLLYDSEYAVAIGTYGTDVQGKLVDEHHLRVDSANLTTSILQRALQQEALFAVDEQAQLFSNLEVIGTGWNAVAVLWHGTEKLGWLAADNAVQHMPMSKPLLDTLTLYALTLGTLLAQKRTQVALQKTNAQLEQANEEVQRFAYIVSHDLRAPLINLKGFSDILTTTIKQIDPIAQQYVPSMSEAERKIWQTALNDKIPTALRFISTSVDRMDRFTSAILKLSRFGRNQLTFENVVVNDLVRQILQSLDAQIKQQDIEIIIEDLPQVQADRLALDQILGNVIINAIKYLEPERPGQIRIFAEQDEEQTIFHVQDNGRGIAESDYEKIFAPFRRAGRPTVEGEGMGLAYVQTLLKRHQGQIWFTSQPDVGTTFSFTIPKRSEANS